MKDNIYFYSYKATRGGRVFAMGDGTIKIGSYDTTPTNLLESIKEFIANENTHIKADEICLVALTELHYEN